MSELKLERISHPDAASTSIEIAASGAVSFSNDIAFNTNTFYVDTANGRVGIGTTSPETPLHIADVAARITLEDTTNNTDALISSDNNGSVIFFADVNSQRANSMIAFHVDGNPNEVMRIDSSGNLLVGKTAIGQGTAGFEARATGQTFCTDDGNTPFLVNRLTSDGELIQLNKDGTNVGSIGSISGAVSYIVLDPRASGSGLRGSTASILATNNTGANNDNAIDLGSSTTRFKDLYLSGGVYLGGTGSANYLDDYEEGTFTPIFTASGTNPTATFYSQYGLYRKIGSYVWCTINLRINVLTGAGSGDLRISGLPFTANGDGKWSTVYVGETNNFSTTSPRTGMFTHNNNYIQLYGDNGTQSGDFDILVQSTYLNNLTDIWVSFSYPVS